MHIYIPVKLNPVAGAVIVVATGYIYFQYVKIQLMKNEINRIKFGKGE